MTKKILTKIVTEDEADIRLDRWFKRHFPELTHGQLQKLLRTGQVRVGGKRAETSTRLEAGQEIRVPPQVITPPPIDAKKRSDRTVNDLKKWLLFEDDDVLVFNKPAGLAVQGGTGLKENIDDMLRDYVSKGRERPKLVHRLDRDTSGVLLVARNVFAAQKLAEAFRHRDTQKIYWGLSLGVPHPDHGTISEPILKAGDVMKIAETDNEFEIAKTATTFYQLVEGAKKQAAFVAMMPFTGRTHQLRVHMAHLGTPLIGDRLYGKALPPGLPANELGGGLHLHARRLMIPHPRRGTIDVTAPLSPAMRKSWKYFGFDENAQVDFNDA